MPSYNLTDSHSYLLFSSSQPSHIKKSIPYSQFLRLRCLRRDDRDFETTALEMRSFFVQFGYPNLLDTAIQKVFGVQLSRSDTLKPSSEQISTEKVPLVLNFRPFNYKVRDIITRNFGILKNDSKTSSIFIDNPLISFQCNKSIRDCLVHSALKQNSSLPPGTFTWGRARCNTCALLSQTTVILGSKSKLIIRHNFTCISSNIDTSFTAYLAAMP